MKFRLLTGCHTEGRSDKGTFRVYHKGDVIESKVSLLPLNKGPNSIKFEKVHDNTPATLGGEPLGKPSKAAVMEPVDDELEAMTVVDLKHLAEAEEIELDNTMKKDEIVSCIRVARDLS